MKKISRRRFVVGSATVAAFGGPAQLGCVASDPRGTAPASPQGRYASFRPGELWLDTAGKPIQAHAGSLIAVGDTFYWYGENKEFTDGKSAMSGCRSPLTTGGHRSGGAMSGHSMSLRTWEADHACR